MTAMKRRMLTLVIFMFVGVSAMALPAAGGAGENAEKGRNRGYTPTEGNSAQPKSSNYQGSSKNQSNPDGGGIDKPVPATQGTSDHDWNNGCGNDDDRDDDNNGWCGRKHEHERAAASHPEHREKVRFESVEGAHLDRKAEVMGVEGSRKTRNTDVLGASGSAPRSTSVLGAEFSLMPAAPTTEVLGVGGAHTEVLGAGFDASALPLTGMPMAAGVLVGLSLVLSGAILLRR